MASHDRLHPICRQALGLLALYGIAITVLAQAFKVSRVTARRWRDEAWKSHPNYQDRKGRGRKSSTNSNLKKRIRAKAAKRATAREIRKHLLTKYGVSPSQSTIRRVLKSGKNPMHWAPVSRGKRLSHANVGKRLKYCRQNIHTNFSTVVFMDAKDLYLYYDKGGYSHHCWQSINNPPPPVQQSNPYVFRFYAAVGMDFKSSLYFVPPSPKEGTKQHKSKETYTSTHYISMMEGLGAEIKRHYGEHGYQIIQDHARQHCSKASKHAMQQMGLHFQKDFPPQSWDLNIIENVWGILDDQLLHMNANTTDGWRNAIKGAWGQVQQGSINQLVKGMPCRIKNIIENGGAWVSHH